jgi:Uma2 family endonuclease
MNHNFEQDARVPDNLDELPDGYVPFAPDLAVEVVSSNDEPKEVNEKVAQYLKYGTRLVWVMYTDKQEVKVHVPHQKPRTLKVSDTLDGGDVLPGFKIAVKDIFRRR